MSYHGYARLSSYSILALSFFLTACDGDKGKGTGSSPSKGVASTAISAQNATFVTDYKDSYYVDLSDRVSVSGGKDFKLSAVTPLANTSECQPIDKMSQGFTVGASSTKSCDYEYEVVVVDSRTKSETLSTARSTESGSDIAIARVAVSKATSAESSQLDLPAVNASTLMENTVEVDVKRELLLQSAYAVPAGYSLSSEVSLPYSNNTAVVDPLTDTISYIPTDGFQGIERILFSYENDTTGDILLGTLDVAVHDDANQGFAIQSDITYEPVEINNQVVIDVSPYVTSLDGDGYQLVHVDSFNAATEPFDTDDLSNRKFTFETSTVDNHYVSFAVSDNNGSYGIGVIEIPSFDVTSLGQWDDIVLKNNISYSAPFSHSESMSLGITPSDKILDDSYSPAVSIALYDYTQGVNICSGRGRVPSVVEMTSLYNEGIKSTHNWPVSSSYLTHENGVAKIIDMVTGIISDPEEGVSYLLTCAQGGLTAEGSTENIVADGHASGFVNFTLTEASSNEETTPVEGEVIQVTTTSSNAILSSSSLTTDAQGRATLTVSNDTVEITEVCGTTSADVSTCYNLQFVADKLTSHIVDIQYATAGWITGSVEGFPIQVEVKDATDNPVENVIVDFETDSDSDVMFNSSHSTSVVTDKDGIATAQMVNLTSQSSDSVMVAANHTNNNGELSTRSIETLWGTWQWETPLRLKFYEQRAGASGFTCRNEYGSEWRAMTQAEASEWVNAYNSGEISFNTLWRKDPILSQANDWFANGRYINADPNKSITFWVGDAAVGSQSQLAIRYVDVYYDEVGIKWGAGSDTNLVQMLGWNWESFTFAKDVTSWVVRAGADVMYSQICVSPM